MFFLELPPQFKHVLRYILYLLYVHSLIHRFHNEREDEEGEGGGRQRKADKQEFISEIRLGMALTKTFLHMPLMGANPIGFK